MNCLNCPSSPLVAHRISPDQKKGICPDCGIVYSIRSKHDSEEDLGHYYFFYHNYQFCFWVMQNPKSSYFWLLKNKEFILTLDHLPNVNPNTANQWLNKINNLKAFH